MPIDVEIPEVDTVVTFPDGMTQDEMAKAINLRFFPTPTNIAASHDTMPPPPGGLIGGVPAVIGPDEQKAMEEIGADIARRPPEPRIPYPIPFEMTPFNLSPESSLMKGKGVVAGVGRSVAKVVNGMLTEPSNVFALALGAIPGVARRAVGAYFAFKAMEEFPHIVVQAEDNWDKMNAGQKAEAYSDLGIAALTVLGGGKLAAGKPVEMQLAERVPEIVKSSEFKEFVAAQEKAAQPTLETLAPKTAEALKAAEVPVKPEVPEAKPTTPVGPSPIEAAEAFKEPERAAVSPEDYVEPAGEVMVRGEEFKPKEPAPVAPEPAKPAEAPAETPAVAKEPWEMTKAEWAMTDVGLGATERPVRFLFHKEEVAQALREGKPVPPEVLADYPELKPKAPPAAETQAGKTEPEKRLVLHVP